MIIHLNFAKSIVYGLSEIHICIYSESHKSSYILKYRVNEMTRVLLLVITYRASGEGESNFDTFVDSLTCLASMTYLLWQNIFLVCDDPSELGTFCVLCRA